MRALLLALLLTGCAASYQYSETWLTQEEAVEQMYLYAKVNGAPFRADFYDSVESRFAIAPVDTLTRAQLRFILADIRGMRVIDSLETPHTAYFHFKQQALHSKYELARAVERAKR
jgi:hypothetical protein